MLEEIISDQSMCLLIGLNGLCDQQQISRMFSVEKESADGRKSNNDLDTGGKRRFMNTVNDSLLNSSQWSFLFMSRL